jgi:hypothetical protein
MKLLTKVSDCSKRSDNEAAVEKKPEAYPHFTRPALSRPRPALSQGYVEDFFEARTKLGAFFSSR